MKDKTIKSPVLILSPSDLQRLMLCGELLASLIRTQADLPEIDDPFAQAKLSAVDAWDEAYGRVYWQIKESGHA